jgi:peroxiredoxin
MRKSVIMFTLVIVMITSLLSGYACSQKEGGNTPGEMAVDFQLLDIYGNQVALSDLKGQPVMLNFWATWCSPCKFEMPFFQEIYEDEKWLQEGLVILAVDYQENVNDVQLFIIYYGYSFTVLLDTSGEIGNMYNIRGLPTTFFIGKDGIIKDIQIGAFSSKEQIEQKLSLITN